MSDETAWLIMAFLVAGGRSSSASNTLLLFPSGER
jgi:hypothetical protein